ncbi:MAG: hypothetical protein KDC86_03480 [Saprospiraceae bacterium]|nr:hypothetical protein [Saprospiraceae bacterium]
MSFWKLLAETRKHCIRAAIVGAGLCVLLVFVQSVSGLLEGIMAQGWVWVMVIVLLPLLVLWASTFLNRYPAKIVRPLAHQALVYGSWLYFLLALFTLLSEPFATQGDRSLQQYLYQSLWWMMPLELILVVGYVLLFYRKNLIFKPNEQIILDFASQKAVAWENKGHVLRQQCFELIAANDLDGALGKMKEAFEKSGSADMNAAVLLESQFHNLSKERDLNMVDRDKAQVELNRITMAIMNLIEKL